MEVLYDLDVEAADTCREPGVTMERAEAVNTHPRFIDALADAVLEVWARYAEAEPALPLTPADVSGSAYKCGTLHAAARTSA